MNLNDDIQIRLKSAKELSKKLQTGIGINDIPQEDRVYREDIIHVLDDLIAIPDYLMTKLLAHHNIQAPNSHFPLFKDTPSYFRQYMSRHYSMLDSNHELYQKLESIQYYHDKPKNEWMKFLFELGNTSKHAGIPSVTSRMTEAVVIWDNNRPIVQIPEWAGGIKYTGGDGGLPFKIGDRELNLPNEVNTKTITKSSNYDAENVDYMEWYFDYNGKAVKLCVDLIEIGIESLLKDFIN